MHNSSVRRSDFDVANHIKVTDPVSVLDYVCNIYTESYGPRNGVAQITQAFQDFTRLFEGEYDGYHGCDTLYHDMQHTLDMTLAMSRLLNGYERQHPRDGLGEKRFVLGVIIALFHDSGYIRSQEDSYASNGAVYTLTHVSRSGEFLKKYLPTIELESYAELAATLVHFTGYEIDLEDLKVPDPRDRMVGHLLGTADLIAQMSDRCYLEKCRDRLYPEFVICGMAGDHSRRMSVLFDSPEDLLLKTPAFFRNSVLKRLERNFNSAFNYATLFFQGNNPYMATIEKNIGHLEALTERGDFSALKRCPPQTNGADEFPYYLLDATG